MSHSGCWDLPRWWGHTLLSLLTGDGNRSSDIMNFTLIEPTDPGVDYCPAEGVDLEHLLPMGRGRSSPIAVEVSASKTVPSWA